MAKSAREREAQRGNTDAKGAKASSKASTKTPAAGPLAAAESALARGDVRSARKALAALDANATEEEKAAARALRSRLGFDKQALAIALAVLAVLAAAAIWALFSRHG